MHLPHWPVWAQEQASKEDVPLAQGALLRRSCEPKQEPRVAQKKAGNKKYSESTRVIENEPYARHLARHYPIVFI